MWRWGRGGAVEHGSTLQPGQGLPIAFRLHAEAFDEGRQARVERLWHGILRAVPFQLVALEADLQRVGALVPFVELEAVMRLEDGMPDLRRVAEGRNAAGRGWIGLTPRNAYVTTDVKVTPLIAAWLFMLLALALSVAGWLREGRR